MHNITFAHAVDDHLDSIPSIRKVERVSFNHVSAQLWPYLVREKKPDVVVDLTIPQADGAHEPFRVNREW